jgi:glycosyl hydrolase family 106( putative alpha-L-rhamnosidase)
MNLKNPEAKYRPIPFWSWNDKLENEELCHQVRMMNNAGIGGYFMHARGGLLTEYMGDEWFYAVDACLEQGKAVGMNSWAYDENGWPSGFGNGKVNGLGVKYQQKYLRYETIKECDFKETECTISTSPADNGNILHFYYDVNPYYVDTLDSEVTEKFIEEIYQSYYDKLCAEGRSPEELTGFFTDEPQISRNGMPWSFILDDEYEKAYGDNLLELLPHLFFEQGDFRKTRYRVWKLITELFMNNFMKPIHDWCDKRGWQLTGHHVLEESYWSQLTSNGAIMPQYQYYHIPGMDWLGRHIKPVTTPVQVASVCAQLGKKQILSETFALCGWNVKFEELKWMLQWQMVHGINLLCQHLESYSLKGIRKRDYPASLFRHQPWWKDYRDFNDYVSRIGVLLSEGEIKIDTLVLHGQSSAWLEYTANEPDNDNIEKYFQSFLQISDLLDCAHVNYHYGDETMIDMHGSVSEKSFVIGKQKYSTVLIPQINNISAKVFELLKQFTTNGGKVLAVNNSIDNSFYVDGELSPELSELTKNFICFDRETEMVSAINKYTECLSVVKSGTAIEKIQDFNNQLHEINYTRRFFNDFDGEEAKFYYFVNNDLHEAYNVEIYLPEQSVERFEPATGETVPVKYELCNGAVKIVHDFVPAGDLLLIAKKTVKKSADSKNTTIFGTNVIDLNGEYEVKLDSENVMTLDYCSFSFDGELQERNEYVMCIQDRLLKKRREVELEMNFTFDIDADYDCNKELFLIIERPELYEIKLNGESVPNKNCGFMYDPAFKRVAINDFIQSGKNVITLNTRFKQSEKVYKALEAAAVFESEKNKLSYDMEIEAIYLAGDFGVKTTGDFAQLEREAVRYSGDFSLTKVPANANISKLHESGFPFFSGTLTLEKEFKLNQVETLGRVLKFDQQKATVSKVKVNGEVLSKFLWKPFTASLDGFLQEGNNIIEIELSNSLRNMLGPHHLEEGESYSVGPFSFYKESGIFSAAWNGSNNSWNDAYCFVEFGIDNIRID